MSRNIIVAVWGSRGAGKGTYSAALAQCLSRYFRAELLINADVMQPAFAMWGVIWDEDSSEKENLKVESIGKILTNHNLTEEYLRHRILYHPDNKYIGLMGYQTNDDCEATDPIEGNDAQSLLNETRKMFQVTIVDCTLPQTDKITENALQVADIVIILLEPNCLGVGFLKAQSSFIRHNLVDNRQKIFIAAKVEPTSAVKQFEYRLGVRLNKFNLPFTQQARDNLNTLSLFQKYDGEYQTAVESVAERIKEVAEQ